MSKKNNHDADHIQEAAVYQSQTPSFRLDKEAGILYGVKFVNWTGKNGQRRYARQAVEDAVSRKKDGYEGAKVYLDHASINPTDLTASVRGVESLFARLKGCRVEDDGGYGNLHYNKGHSWARAFEWICESDPELIGLSHDALLAGPYGKDGVREVIELPKIFSVDLVSSPGSTRSLREDAGMEPEQPDPAADPNSGMANPGVDMASVNGDDLSESLEHLSQYIAALVKDPALDSKEKVKRIKKALTLLTMEDDEPDGDESAKPSPKDTKPETKPEKEMPEDKDTKGLESANAEVARLKDLNQKQQLELEKFRALESANDARKAAVDAKVPANLITPLFIQRMVDRGRESWAEEIADRKLQVGTTTDPISSTKTTTAVEPGKGGEAFAAYAADAYKNRS